jgi:GDP/UDP-N,N'-diacetylbacillosamine 2-epimerase (hydrolysing)
MHLSPEYGLTYKEIEQAGFSIDAKVEILLSSDSVVGVTKSMGLSLIGFADVYSQLMPDLVVVLGDRFEIFSATAAALVACIPVAHLHGGETTEGAFDEAFRHSITKMSHLHFVASDEYRKRVIQLGEHPDRVFLVGGLGVDAIKRNNLLAKEELEKDINFKFGKHNLLISFHPVTLESSTAASQIRELLAALDELHDTKLIFTMPNADTGGRDIGQIILDYVANNPKSCVHTSLGHLRYLSCMQYVDGVVGNSSSGLLEAPTMNIGTVNIGDRQKGRLSASSVINCSPTRISIGEAIKKLYDPAFKMHLSKVVNPYGNGGASEKIIEILNVTTIDNNLLKKSFLDLFSNNGNI